MRVRLIVLSVVLSLGVSAHGKNKGLCPPAPPTPKKVTLKPSRPRIPPDPDSQFVGTVVLMAVISDKGYVCSTHVVQGLDKETDKKALTDVREWHFPPAQKSGHPVAVVITLEVDYWRKNGELIRYPERPSEEAQDPVHTER